MISVTATITEGCTASLDLESAEAAARYIWEHRWQAESWEIKPDSVEPEIMEHIWRLREREAGSLA